MRHSRKNLSSDQKDPQHFDFFRRYRALHFPFSRRLRRRNRPPSDLKQTPNHDAFLPPETWRKRLLLAVQSRCAAFQPSATWRTQLLRAFQHASGKFRRGAALGPAVSWKRSTMRHGRHGVPVALPTTVNAGAYHVDGLAACWAACRSEPCAIAWLIALK